MKGRKEKAPYHAWSTGWGLSPSTSWQNLSVQIFPGARISPKAETHIHLQIQRLCQQDHNATSSRQEKVNMHGNLQVVRNVGFAGWG